MKNIIIPNMATLPFISSCSGDNVNIYPKLHVCGCSKLLRIENLANLGFSRDKRQVAANSTMGNNGLSLGNAKLYIPIMAHLPPMVSTRRNCFVEKKRKLKGLANCIALFTIF
jgi:hypothetical protein